MLEKVIVLELKESYAIAMKQGGEMIRIQRKDGMRVGDKIYILPEDLYKEQAVPSVLHFPANHTNAPKRQQRALLRQLAGMAAAIALVFTLVLYGNSPSVCAVASFDGQQDLQLELDEKCRIVGGSSQGEQITATDIRQLKGRQLSDVGSELRSLVGDGPVLIGYASYKDDADGDTQAEQLLREMFSEHIILYLLGNGEDIEQAESSQKSLGYHLAGEVISSHHKEKLDDFLEAYAEYKAHLDDDDDDEDDDEDTDFSYLNDMSLDQLLNEIYKNPEYEGKDDVLEILADKVEDLHEEHKEDSEDSEEHDSDDSEDTDSEDSDDTDSDDSSKKTQSSASHSSENDDEEETNSPEEDDDEDDSEEDSD